MVIPVPDSREFQAALGYAAQSGILFEYGIMKSHVGRTFIEPTQRDERFKSKNEIKSYEIF